MIQFLQDLFTLFRNKQLNAETIEGDFVEQIRQGKVENAISMMQEYDAEVDEAIREYNPETHKVMSRPNKKRKRGTPYISEKLPRKRQQFINEVALFFLLNNPIIWSKTGGDDEAFKIFTDFLQDTHFHTTMRRAKRLAGAETECAKLYHVFRNDEGNPDCRVLVLARSTGYRLRSLIDQYGKMQAFAYGYTTKSKGKSTLHWDIQTKDFIFNCTKQRVGWKVETFPNPTDKINAIYFKQKKEWDGVQLLCDREESATSRQADNNNYFSDPIACATADVIKSMADPNAIGKFIQLNGQNSDFKYINPPQPAEGWNVEKSELKSAILNDSFTPDFTYEGIKGYGTLTGAALRNALVIGYIKRNTNIEVYWELITREVNVILGVLKILHPQVDFDSLRIQFEFADPFDDDKSTLINTLVGAKGAGIVSTKTAVKLAGLAGDSQEELERISQEQASKSEIEKK